MKNRVLEISGVEKSYGCKKVLAGVSLQLKHGEVFGFLGPNGAGKTTLIRIVLGLINPEKGSVCINGFDITKNFKSAIAQVGAVVESPKFYPYLSGYQNMLLVKNLHPHIPESAIYEKLSAVGLADRAKDKVMTYSLGMKQRLGLARSLINKPKIVFLDEPMNGLDPQGMHDIRMLIKKLQRENDLTFFITSHLLHEVEQVCDKIAVLKEGRVVTTGNIADLLNRDSEFLEVYTANPGAAAALQGYDFIRSVESFPDKLVVEIEKGFSAKVNTILVGGNIDVAYLVPKQHSLEEYFMTMAHGGEEH